MAAAAAAAIVLLERRRQLEARRRERRHERKQQRRAQAPRRARTSARRDRAPARRGCRWRRSCSGRSRSPEAPCARRRRRPTQARTVPHTPATAAITSPSVSSCCTRRRRPEPMASRTAISRRRTRARASSRLATLTQAMTSTHAAAASSTRADCRSVGSTRASRSGTAVAPHTVPGADPLPTKREPDRRQLRVRLRERHAILQPRHDADEVLRRREVLRIGQTRRHRRRNPELGLAGQARETLRQDPDNRQRHVVDDNRAADTGGIARKLPLPQPRS